MIADTFYQWMKDSGERTGITVEFFDHPKPGVVWLCLRRGEIHRDYALGPIRELERENPTPSASAIEVHKRIVDAVLKALLAGRDLATAVRNAGGEAWTMTGQGGDS